MSETPAIPDVSVFRHSTDDARPQPGDLSRLIGRDEFAARLTIGVSTLDRLRAAGKIGPRTIKCGGAVRFLLSEIVAWLSSPDRAGELHDAATWPAIWQAMEPKARRAQR